MNGEHAESGIEANAEASAAERAAAWHAYDMARARRNRRVGAVIVFLGCAAVLSIAVWLTPSEDGYGTHREMGLAPCGMLVTTGLPCPTCGMTTAFAYTVRGRMIRAFLAQPTGMILAIGTVVLAFGCIWVFITGRIPEAPFRYLTPYRLCLLLLVLLLGGWGFKLIYGLATGELPAHFNGH